MSYGSFVVETKSVTQAGLHIRFCGNLDVKQKMGGILIIRYILLIHPVTTYNHIHQIVSDILLWSYLVSSTALSPDNEEISLFPYDDDDGIGPTSVVFPI